MQEDNHHYESEPPTYYPHPHHRRVGLGVGLGGGGAPAGVLGPLNSNTVSALSALGLAPHHGPHYAPLMASRLDSVVGSQAAGEPAYYSGSYS